MKGLLTPALLATSLTIPACQTLTDGTERRAAEADARIAAGVCEVWLPVTWSSRDTSETQAEVRANNRARDAYCGDS